MNSRASTDSEQICLHTDQRIRHGQGHSTEPDLAMETTLNPNKDKTHTHTNLYLTVSQQMQ